MVTVLNMFITLRVFELTYYMSIVRVWRSHAGMHTHKDTWYLSVYMYVYMYVHTQMYVYMYVSTDKYVTMNIHLPHTHPHPQKRHTAIKQHIQI